MDLKEIQKRLMLSQSELAEMMGVTVATLWRWQNGLGKPNKIYMQFLKELEEKGKEQIQIRPETIRAIRKSNDLTQEEFAKILGTCAPTLGDWESGRHTPRKDMQRKIYEFYKKNR